MVYQIQIYSAHMAPFSLTGSIYLHILAPRLSQVYPEIKDPCISFKVHTYAYVEE